MPVNVFADEFDERESRPGYERTDFWAAARLGAKLLGASIYELPAGQSTWPYHFHHGNEELLVVLAGAPTLRDPDGERELARGDVLLFKRGPEGAHKLTNRGQEPARVLIFSSQRSPEVVEYPDSGKVLAASKFGRFRFRAGDAGLDYWEGEP